MAVPSSNVSDRAKEKALKQQSTELSVKGHINKALIQRSVRAIKKAGGFAKCAAFFLEDRKVSLEKGSGTLANRKGAALEKGNAVVVKASLIINRPTGRFVFNNEGSLPGFPIFGLASKLYTHL